MGLWRAFGGMGISLRFGKGAARQASEGEVRRQGRVRPVVCGGRLITAGSEYREMRPRPLFLLLLIQVQYCTQRESTIEQYALSETSPFSGYIPWHL